MDTSNLPKDVQDKVMALRAKGGPRAEMVEMLLRKRAAAEPNKRAGVDRLIMDLDKPGIGSWIAGVLLVGAMLVVVGQWVVDYRYEQAVLAGVPITAEVMRMDQGDCFLNDDGNLCVKLTLRLHPTRGEAYSASLDHSVSQRWLSRIQPGNWLTVAVDRTEPTRVYFDERAMSVPPPSPVKRAKP